MLRTRWRGANLPVFSTIRSSQDGPIRTAGPRDFLVDRVNAAQVSGRLRLLKNPLGTRVTREQGHTRDRKCESEHFSSISRSVVQVRDASPGELVHSRATYEPAAKLAPWSG
jgi:hypothetical protein